MDEKRILRRIETKLQKFPKIGNFMRGTLRQRYIRCGKPDCRCKQPGEEAHGPYIYIEMAGPAGKTISVLIPNRYAEQATSLIKNYSLFCENAEKITQLNLDRFAILKSKQKARAKR